MPPCSLNIHARLVTVTGGSEEEDIRERVKERCGVELEGEKKQEREGGNQMPVHTQYKQKINRGDRRHL